MNKFIAVAMMLVSFSTFGTEPTGAVDSFLSVLPFGSFSGRDDNGVRCNVSVHEVNFPSKSISVTVEKENQKIFKIINDNSSFLFRSFKQEYIQNDRTYVDATRNSYVERIIRTVNAGDSLLYVIVANEFTANREVTVDAVDCVVHLER